MGVFDSFWSSVKSEAKKLVSPTGQAPTTVSQLGQAATERTEESRVPQQYGQVEYFTPQSSSPSGRGGISPPPGHFVPVARQFEKFQSEKFKGLERGVNQAVEQASLQKDKATFDSFQKQISDQARQKLETARTATYTDQGKTSLQRAELEEGFEDWAEEHVSPNYKYTRPRDLTQRGELPVDEFAEQRREATAQLGTGIAAGAVGAYRGLKSEGMFEKGELPVDQYAEQRREATEQLGTGIKYAAGGLAYGYEKAKDAPMAQLFFKSTKGTPSEYLYDKGKQKDLAVSIGGAVVGGMKKGEDYIAEKLDKDIDVGFGFSNKYDITPGIIIRKQGELPSTAVNIEEPLTEFFVDRPKKYSEELTRQRQEGLTDFTKIRLEKMDYIDTAEEIKQKYKTFEMSEQSAYDNMYDEWAKNNPNATQEDLDRFNDGFKQSNTQRFDNFTSRMTAGYEIGWKAGVKELGIKNLESGYIKTLPSFGKFKSGPFKGITTLGPRFQQDPLVSGYLGLFPKTKGELVTWVPKAAAITYGGIKVAGLIPKGIGLATKGVTSVSPKLAGGIGKLYRVAEAGYYGYLGKKVVPSQFKIGATTYKAPSWVRKLKVGSAYKTNQWGFSGQAKEIGLGAIGAFGVGVVAYKAGLATKSFLSPQFGYGVRAGRAPLPVYKMRKGVKGAYDVAGYKQQEVDILKYGGKGKTPQQIMQWVGKGGKVDRTGYLEMRVPKLKGRGFDPRTWGWRLAGKKGGTFVKWSKGPQDVVLSTKGFGGVAGLPGRTGAGIGQSVKLQQKAVKTTQDLWSASGAHIPMKSQKGLRFFKVSSDISKRGIVKGVPPKLEPGTMYFLPETSSGHRKLPQVIGSILKGQSKYDTKFKWSALPGKEREIIQVGKYDIKKLLTNKQMKLLQKGKLANVGQFKAAARDPTIPGTGVGSTETEQVFMATKDSPLYFVGTKKTATVYAYGSKIKVGEVVPARPDQLEFYLKLTDKSSSVAARTKVISKVFSDVNKLSKTSAAVSSRFAISRISPPPLAGLLAPNYKTSISSSTAPVFSYGGYGETTSVAPSIPRPLIYGSSGGGSSGGSPPSSIIPPVTEIVPPPSSSIPPSSSTRPPSSSYYPPELSSPYGIPPYYGKGGGKQKRKLPKSNAFRLFQPQVRKRGKWIPLGSPTTKGRALKRGYTFVTTTVAASFKITPTKGKTKKKDIIFDVPFNGLFRRPKGKKEKGADIFIQKKKKRLVTKAERKDIQFMRTTKSKIGGTIKW